MASGLGNFKADSVPPPRPGQRQRFETGRTWAADELFDFKDGPWRQELIEGELYRMAPTGIEHGRLENRFGFLLSSHVFTNSLGEVLIGDNGFVVSRLPDTVMAPDVACISCERMGLFHQVERFSLHPADLVAEVLSPGDLAPEVLVKIAHWLEFGVKAVVLIMPKSKTIVLYRSMADFHEFGLTDSIDLDFVVPRFQLKVADLFA